ncbi:hypothetical protein GCM10027275_14780 [Rhabdobacter roseus]|uniref:Ig-like domain-containing protein n=1 Tax=Rhabdobacter roseus TaxID=1655419 RepID=A0A840TTN3_9BACT|nr:M43 family zinc metalloprotease [Rhabdobacter roseus]MBB5283398.1 hypothetical protein [Rhabdobacter roseus]
MKHIALLLLTSLTIRVAAQAPVISDSLLPCGVTDSFLTKQIDPQVLKQMNSQWEEYSKRSTAKGRLSAEDPVLVVPVIFHIAHRGEALGSGSNLSEGRIQAALAILNNIFRARGKYASANDTRIEFVLANCSGIDRADASGVPNFLNLGVNYYDYNQIQQVTALFGTYQDKVVNIYVSHSISGASGFAYYGGDIFITTGEFPNATGYNASARVFAHEMGHSLFLHHTFQGDNSCSGCPSENVICPVNTNPLTDGDQVADTSPHRVQDLGFDTPETALNPCTDAPFGIGTIRNHMAYGNNADRFTPGQIARMRFFLETYLTKWIYSDAIPTPNNQLSLWSVPASVCANSSVTVGFNNNSGSSNPVFLIQKGDDVVQYVDISTNPASFIFPESAFGSIYFNLSSGNDYRIRVVAGCNSQLSQAIQVNNGAIYAALIVDANNQLLPNTDDDQNISLSRCPGSSLTLKARLTNLQNNIEVPLPESDLTNFTYQWTLDGAPLAGATGISYAASGNGVYRYAVTSSLCTSQSKTSKSATLSSNAMASSTTSGAYGGRLPLERQCTGSTVNLYSTYASNSASYTWYKDGIAIPGETRRTFIAGNKGTYRVIASDGSCIISVPGDDGVALNFSSVLENHIFTRKLTTSGFIEVKDSLVCRDYMFMFGADFWPEGANGQRTRWAEGLSYQWLRNGVEIQSATYLNYSTNLEGIYSLRIRQGTCESISNSKSLYKSDKAQKPEILTPTSFGNGVSYYLHLKYATNQEWFKDDQPLNNRDDSLLVSTPGVYKVRKSFSQCAIDSDPVLVSFGNTLSPMISARDSVRLVCNSASSPALLYLEQKFFQSTSGLSYRWMKDGIDLPLSDPYADKDTILIFQNGVYQLRVSNGLASGVSNPIRVSSVSNQTVQLSSLNGQLTSCNGTSIRLTFPSTSLVNPVLTWMKDDVLIPGQSNSWLNAQQSGIYTASYQGNGCTITSEPIQVTVGGPLSLATLTGSQAIRVGENANLLLSSTVQPPFYYKLSDGSEYYPQTNSHTSVKAPSVSTTYTLINFGTPCGLGNTAGVAQIDVTNCLAGTTNYTLNSGLWSNPYIWSCGSVPTVLDPVRVNSAHTIYLQEGNEARSKSIELQGQLEHGSNSNLHIGQN